MLPTYFTRNEADWRRVISWRVSVLGDDLYSACMNRDDMPMYRHAPHGIKDGIEVDAAEFIRLKKDTVVRIKEEEGKRTHNRRKGIYRAY